VVPFREAKECRQETIWVPNPCDEVPRQKHCLKVNTKNSYSSLYLAQRQETIWLPIPCDEVPIPCDEVPIPCDEVPRQKNCLKVNTKNCYSSLHLAQRWNNEDNIICSMYF